MKCVKVFSMFVWNIEVLFKLFSCNLYLFQVANKINLNDGQWWIIHTITATLEKFVFDPLNNLNGNIKLP